jgi:hypothetical protein
MECTFFENCSNTLVTVEKYNDTGPVPPTYWDINKWSAHSSGGLLTRALKKLQVHADRYGSDSISRKAAQLYWIAAKSAEFHSHQKQLGAYLTELASAVRDGHAWIPGTRQESFIAQMMYESQRAGIPIGDQVTKEPPNAEMIALDIPGGPSVPLVDATEGIELSTVGSVRNNADHVIRIWLDDPLQSTFPRQCPGKSVVTPSPIEGTDWLGVASHASFALAFILTYCGNAFDLEGEVFDVYLEAVLQDNDGETSSLTDYGILHSTPRVIVDFRHPDGAEEEQDEATSCGGCRNGDGAGVVPLMLVLIGMWFCLRQRPVAKQRRKADV